MDENILITFEAISAIQANQLAKELRHALLDAAVEAKQSGVIEVEPAHDPNEAGSKGELILRFITLAIVKMWLEGELSKTDLIPVIAETLLLFAGKVHRFIKIKCSEGSESFEVTPQNSKNEIVAKLRNCLKRKLAEMNSDKSQK